MKRIFENLLIFSATSMMIAGCSNCKKEAAPCTTTQPACTQPTEDSADSATVVNMENSATCETEGEVPVVGEERHPMTREFDRQVHNAELADMAIADIHFLPNRSALNSNGTQRLNHLAWLTDQYGGTIKLDMKDPKSKLTDERLATVKAYLKTWGLTDDKIKVEVGLPDNEGMDANEAINVYQDTRYKKSDKNASPLTTN
jgi:hypothetical protein